MAKLETKLKKNGNELFPQAMLNSIDILNILQSGSKKYTSYYDITILEDCYGYISNDGYGQESMIDGVAISTTNGGIIPLKKGQVFSVKSGYNAGHSAYSVITWKIYGIKR